MLLCFTFTGKIISNCPIHIKGVLQCSTTDVSLFFFKLTQILYVDSLEVDEAIESDSVCPIRAAAWTNQLIQAVMQKDRKPNGEFGKLRV